MIETDVLVIGAGVVGLSCLNKIPKQFSALLIEQQSGFGKETSSRNSEVIHSGIYYPHGSKKTEHCKVGRNEIYRFCRENQIPHRQCGKYVIATNPAEMEYLDSLAAHCEYEIVPFQRISETWLEKKIPLIKARGALFFPLSGILDSHSYMACLERKARELNRSISYNTKYVRVLEKAPWVVEVLENNQPLQIRAKFVVNAGGLGAARISNDFLNTQDYVHHFCRGRYFQLSAAYRQQIQTLVYPTPRADGLGIHITPDISGNLRLGPDTDWCKGSVLDNLGKYYDCDWDSLLPEFLANVHRYWPSLPASDLVPGFIGIRPKLFIKGKPYADFLVEEKELFIHLLGIESPGLTGSLSLASEVAKLLEEKA